MLEKKQMFLTNLDVAPKTYYRKCDTRTTFEISFCNYLNKKLMKSNFILHYKKRTIVDNNLFISENINETFRNLILSRFFHMEFQYMMLAHIKYM